MADDPILRAAQGQRRQVDAIRSVEPSPFRQALSTMRLGADDAVTFWPMYADHLLRLQQTAETAERRRLLVRASRKAREVGRAAEAFRRDVDRLLQDSEDDTAPSRRKT